MGHASSGIITGEAGKANFDGIYNAPDPREYFRVLAGLDYVIPDLAKGVFRSLIAHCATFRKDTVKVVDVGSSYGINSALIDYPLDIGRLARRYSAPEVYELPSKELMALDERYFGSWPKLTDASFVGVDTSENAVAYARNVGLLQGVVTSNLEATDPSDAERCLLRDTDLVISTGCVGYVTEGTFRRILGCHEGGTPPIVASFVLRMYPYHDIMDELRRVGLTTEKLAGVTFVQRRFDSREEYQSTIDRLDALGIDPAGKEADGLLHAELFVSRPEEDVKRLPLGELVSVTSGAALPWKAIPVG
jgi:hypothetical protein